MRHKNAILFTNNACSLLATLLTFVVLVEPLFAYQTIARRGLFHDVNDRNTLAENSVNATYRAEALGLPGVDFDLRLSSDNQVLVFHDMISNRATSNDNYGGRRDGVDVGSHPAILVKSRPANSWIGTGLKSFGRNGRIILADGAQKLETLDSMLSYFENLNNLNFWLILDIHDPSGSRGKRPWFNMRERIILAIYKSFPRSTMESSISKEKLRTSTSSTQSYQLENISNAQKAHSGNGAALMPIVSASVPANNEVASNTARDTLAWAKSAGRKTMSILPNPDAGRIINTQCTLWTYQSGSVKAARFDEAARKAKLAFVEIAKPDYVVLDLMGDLGNRRWIGDFSSYIIYLC
ncbi:hypothetical protein D6C97_06821 [Aureobasidium pullulans]|nr:hypothetical protein D6C97_06821 [Aureobasidium pullulans]